MYTKLAYVAGPYRSSTETGLFTNILHARKVAIDLWKKGYAVICPHSNAAFFGGECPDSAWLAGDNTMLKRCDLVVMTPDWRESQGARAEFACANLHGIPVHYWPDVPDAPEG
jgi:hypothetical protein